MWDPDDLEDEPEEDNDDNGSSEDEFHLDPAAAGPAADKDGAVKQREKLKVEMQVIHMSEESQLRVEKMLKELHGDHFRFKDASAYLNTDRG